MAICHLSNKPISRAQGCIAAAVLLLVALCVLSACKEGKRPFRIVQFCLAGPSDLAALKSEFAFIAHANGMTFGDRSADTKEELKTINAAQAKADMGQLNETIRAQGRRLESGEPLINMSIGGDDGIGLGAGSIEPPSYQVAIGFSEGSDPAKASAFADSVVVRLSQRWHVKSVPHPESTGAFPLKDCT